MDVTTLRAKLDAAHYIYDESLVTTLLVALKLGSSPYQTTLWRY